MVVTNISDFRKDIKSYFDRVSINETLIINHGKDLGIVVISLEEYNSLYKQIMNCRLELTKVD
jgi:antitoxin YefM